MSIANTDVSAAHTQEANLVDGLYSLEELIDLDRLREVLEDFSQATGLTTSLASYPDQEILVASGWRDACTLFHRACPESAAHCRKSDVLLTSGLRDQKECNLSPCGLGLVDGATPVLIKGQHVASLFTGQVLFEKPDMEEFRQQAALYGYDPGDYLAAVSEVPIVTEVQLQKALSALAGIASMIGEQGLANLKLRESSETLQREMNERLTAQKALSESERRFSTVLESTPVGAHLYRLEPDGRLVFEGANPAASKILGTDCSRFVDLSIEEAFPPLANTEVPDRYRLAASEGIPWQSDQVDYTDDRISGAFQVHAFQTLPNRMAAMFLDITDRMQAESQVKQAHAEIRQIFEHSMVGIFRTEYSGTIIYSNPAILRLMGYDSVEAMNRVGLPNMYRNPADRERLMELVRRGPVESFETQMLRADGTIIDIILTIYPVLADDGKLRFLEGNLIDNTERKQAEEELQKLAEAVKHSGELVNLATLEGKMVFLNNAGGRMLGLDPGDIGHANIMEVIPDQWVELVEREVLPTLMRGEKWEGDLQYRNLKTGDLTDVHAMTFTVKDPNTNEPQFLANVSMDISDRIRAEAELVKFNEKLQLANQQLQARQQELEEFTYTVSHDLKAPVVSITGFVNLLSEQIAGQLNATQRHYLERIESNARTMEDLLRDLLELSQVGGIDEEAETVDMTALTDEIIGGLTVAAAPRRIELVRLGQLPPSVARYRRIKQVLTNLLDNAIKYLPEKTAGRVEVGYNAGKKDLSGRAGAYFVRDNGRGIAPELHAKIFNLFQRGPGSQDIAAGTGVGLTASRRIIESHGGHLWFDSEVDRGSTFFFSLPAGQTITTSHGETD